MSRFPSKYLEALGSSGQMLFICPSLASILPSLHFLHILKDVGESRDGRAFQHLRGIFGEVRRCHILYETEHHLVLESLPL